MMKRSCEMYDTHGCVAEHRTVCMISYGGCRLPGSWEIWEVRVWDEEVIKVGGSVCRLPGSWVLLGVDELV